jgi:hypothetical protein
MLLTEHWGYSELCCLQPQAVVKLQRSYLQQTAQTAATIGMPIPPYTLNLCVVCGSEDKRRLFPYTALTDCFYNWDGVCLLRGTDWIFMCFVWIWEQTAIISLYSINWPVFITEAECLLRGTDWICVLCRSENKQRLFPYTALTDWFL